MTEEQRKTDLPKVVAAVMTAAPALTLRLGVTYLRMKRRSRTVSRAFTEKLERDGVPPELARKLGESYGSELSLRKLFSSRGDSILQGFKPR